MAKRILIVDDSALSRKRFLAKPLSGAGFEVVEASNGQEGLETWEASRSDDERPFDCIITDLLMPVMDGFQLLEELNERGCEVPVLVASADIQESSRKKIESSGARGFINKPYTSDVLLETVNQVLDIVSKG